MKDPIVERFLLLAQDARGCIHAGETGRLVPFDQRAISSPFPNSRLPLNLGTTPPVALVIDHKSIRPWITLMPESQFQRLSERLWIALGMFTGMLATLFVIAILMMRYQRSALTLAYLGYISALLFFQFQAVGLGAVWLPFWPEPSTHHLLQALAVGTAVIGMALPVFAFLRPCGHLRSLLLISTGLSASSFYLSAFTAEAYRVGAAVIPLLAVLVILLLARRLRDGEPGVRWFAVGLTAAILGGGIQAAAVVTQGTWLPPTSAFAFPLGNLVESICWLIAILMRLKSENLALQQRLIDEAHHDPVTGAYSRAFMTERLNNAIAEAKSSSGVTPGLIYIDLGDFKCVNERFGQARGDQTLLTFARILSELGFDADAIGRFGGDEFMILMQVNAHWSHTEGAAATILGRFREPLQIGGDNILLRPDIALLRITQDDKDVDQLMQDIGLALQLSKQLGGRRAILFEPQMRARAKMQDELRNELERAIRNHQLDLHFQPMVSLENLSPVGFEALLRCEHLSQKGFSIEQVFAVAESAGMLSSLGKRIIELALSQIGTWQRQGVWSPGLFLSINVCQQQLIDEQFLESLHRALQDHGVDASAIRLELSEGSLRADLDWSHQVLPRLLNQHILLGIDNFGTGLASLTMLADLQADYIKIDRKLVAALASLPRAQILARASRQFAAETGSLAIAEGIETNAQLETLRELGFEHGQGHLIAAPMSGPETADWLQLAARTHDQLHDLDNWQRQLH
ncbi:MAG: EAL domain-containing protein [Lamprobacter sp.]|uniref:putative bifunctional diguanylate cyclase/phosphodiesterase n=1 Tax=Lamprobacter sp. TaxID=3100796 RepID=UPI002B25B38E|nr:EAL domain-containing protein [Lamprobacter sp.]MEA3638608.1 EAL domain-containing protein [Lamprobacter sp.]